MYYDAAYAEKDLVDRNFYLDLARKFGGPVLEMGCGTGRITLPVAREGIAVTGVDSSPSMLEVLRRKLDDEQESVKRAVQTIDGDFRTLELAGKFPLVMIPFRPMQHMYTTEDQLAALTSARRHLTEQGVLGQVTYSTRALNASSEASAKNTWRWSGRLKMEAAEPGGVISSRTRWIRST